MPTYQQVPVDKLIEPLNPQRQETLYDGIDELRDSIRSNGLQQPIGVVSLPDSTYRIIWGHRRSIAITQLGWSFAPAMVYTEGEADEDTLMGAENYHRRDINPIEEARYYERILAKYPDGTIGVARECNVSQQRVENLLGLLRGNPKVVESLAAKKISVAQAVEINKFNTTGYQLHALEMAEVEGKSAESLRKWRQDIQRNLQDRPGDVTDVPIHTPGPSAPKLPTDTCNLGNHEVAILDRKYYSICTDHWNVVIEGLEYFGMMATVKEAGRWGEVLKIIRQSKIDLGEVDGTRAVTETT